MPILTESALQTKLPKMIKVRQKFPEDKIHNIKKVLSQELEQEKITQLIKPGQKIAIAIGSRGISNLVMVIKVTVDFIKQLGAEPFIVPAMGSHGGATAEGQMELLHGFGVTEEAVGAPIMSSMEVVLLGHTSEGIPAYIDKNAYNANMVVLINRVKPHTNFRGPIESGLCKMMAIGLGKHVGCSRLHEEGWANMSKTVLEVAKVILEKANVGFGLTLLENAYDQTAAIKVSVNNEIIETEYQLLEKAKANMPAIQVPEIDVLIVEKMGKDISGAGMDPNIINRSALGKIPGLAGPNIKRIVVLGLSDATHGNASGIGKADFITKGVFDNIDFTSTYANMIAAKSPEGARIPIIMEDEREAIIGALQCCGKLSGTGPNIVRISNTLDLKYIWISENMLPLIKGDDRFEVVDE